jgi:hypothetical protein
VQCAEGPINLPLVQGALERTRDGLIVEALQIPEFTEANRSEPGPLSVPPEAWDRSELPAGACVFRLHGFDSSCYRPAYYGDIYTGRCADNSFQISPGSYYSQHQCQGGPPGCPSSKWGRFGNEGYWWYLTPRDGATDLVICADQCQASFVQAGGACFVLNLGR